MSRSVTAIVDTPEEAAALELPPLLVRRPLEAYLDAHGLGSGEVEAEPVGDGHSNVTYLIRRGATELVLRRPPRPPLPPSAHDVLREARLLEAVEGADVRTPKVLLTCADESVIGAPFYVMERCVGDVIVTELPARLGDEAARRGVSEELVDALAEIHAVEWEACGLGDYGKPTGYLDRLQQPRLAQHVVRRGRERRPRRAAQHQLGRAAADLVGDVGVPVPDGLRRDRAAAQAVRVQVRLQRAPHEQRRELERSRLLGGVDDRRHGARHPNR